MRKNIFAFLIPLITLIVIAFTPILNPVLDNFKYKVNSFSVKNRKVIVSQKIIEKLNNDFYENIPLFKLKIKDSFKYKESKIHALNYLFYLNKRNISFINYKDNDNKEKIIKNILRYDRLMKIEYQAILDKNDKPNINLINIYKSIGDINKEASIYSYELVQDNIDKYNLKDYMGKDINYKASNKLVFKTR